VYISPSTALTGVEEASRRIAPATSRGLSGVVVPTPTPVEVTYKNGSTPAVAPPKPTFPEESMLIDVPEPASTMLPFSIPVPAALNREM